MIIVWYTREFIRTYKRLEPALKREIKKRVEEFKDRKNHQNLDVHALTGKMKGLYSFSVNYQYRIVFEYTKSDKNMAYLHKVGGHSVYE